MEQYDFVIADVFTEVAFGGNQLAALPDATGLDAVQMQRIAREVNFAETTVVFPRRGRIFTPKVEVPFAGHPTVGTAAVLADLDVLETGRPHVLEEGIEPVTVDVTRQEKSRIVVRVTLKRDGELRAAELPRDLAAAVLSLPPADVVETWSASVGFPFCFVHVRNRSAVDAATLNHAAWSDRLATAWAKEVFFFSGDFESEARLYARMFAPGVGVAEDPATGSPCEALVGVLAKRNLQRGTAVSLIVDQGVAMERPSVIEASGLVANGALVGVQIGGPSVIVARGRIGARASKESRNRRMAQA